MADIPPPTHPPGPTGAVPPPKKETGKVQPKKETVRINLPPKPTAAPTIKLPTLPPGGPTGAPSAPALAPAPAAMAPPPKTAAAPALAGRASAPAPAQQRPTTMQRPAAPPPPSALKTVDKALIWFTIVACLLGSLFSGYVCYFYIRPLVENFQQ